MAAQYGFNEDQKQQLAELLAQDSSMWATVLYGIYGVDDQIVAVALSQVGNVGGEPYWSWYGFGDWDNKGSSGLQDGQSDHVGIVQKVENGVVYTIEGNSGDSCRVNQYPVGYYEILGYGVVAY